jgi:SEC-C motif
MTVGRNDPCPCGSGRKYKKCHLPLEEPAHPPEPHKSSLHDFDNLLVERVLESAMRRFGEGLQEVGHDFDYLHAEPHIGEFLIPFLAYCVPLQGLPLIEWYAGDQEDALSRREREWIEAQRRSWLSVWEVREVVPGKSMVIVDLLTGEKRLVQEAGATRTLVARDAILARVVDFGEESVLCGTYPRPLPPASAADVIEEVCEGLGPRQPIPVEVMRDHALARALVFLWVSAIRELDERLSRPPRLQNTDGDPFRIVSDRYRFAETDRAAAEAALAGLRGAQPVEVRDDGSRVIVFQKGGNRLHAHWDNTVIGTATLTPDGELALETNSARRATALRKRVERICAGLLSDHRHTSEDPVDLIQVARNSPSEPRPAGADLPIPAELAEAAREEKAAHYATWPDIPVPALGGKTPRQAARSRAGRAQLDVLLKDLENREARQPAELRFDVGRLRKVLGVGEE